MKNYLIKPTLFELEKEYAKSNNERMTVVVHQIGQLLDNQTVLSAEQSFTVLNLLHLEDDGKRPVNEVVTGMSLLINNLFLTALLTKQP